MSIKGFNINGSVQKYDYRSLDNLPSDSGLSEQAKRALLSCFQNVAWVNENGQTYYDALEAALSTTTMYSITNNLTGCTTSNTSAVIEEGGAYTATITASSGYTLDGVTATATMGGQTVTGFYNNGTINIPNVTGNLVITVTAASAVSSISAVFTQGSAIIYDTDSLDTLRQYLTVTATYSDSTTATVSDYTLSGTLTEGTSTITVSYGGKTTTFNVNVTARPLIKNGVYESSDGQIRFTITNNKHIKAEVLTTNLSNFFMLNATNGDISKSTSDSVNNKESFFTVPANTLTTLKMKNVSVYKTSGNYLECILLIRKALSTQSFIATSQARHTTDITASNTPTVNTDIGAIGFGANPGSSGTVNAGTYIEFDVELTVGDTVLIG